MPVVHIDRSGAPVTTRALVVYVAVSVGVPRLSRAQDARRGGAVAVPHPAMPGHDAGPIRPASSRDRAGGDSPRGVQGRPTRRIGDGR